jgi:putative ABC transport system permease protein
VKARALDRKLFRDLLRLRGQAVAIGAVVAAGVAVFVQMRSTFESLELTRESYYEANRFADVFASLKRAPSRVEGDVRRIPGVAQAETRVVFDVTLDVPGQVRPALGRLISIPADGRPTICGMVLREGRYVEPGHDDEVLASETFARANHLRPGDGVAAVINGRRRLLRIVGLALSPEYVYSIRPGEIVSDDALFGVFWMERKALATAFDMQGGFNDVVLRLMHGASARGVVSRLDRILEPYGGLGAQTRALQPSNFYLQGELDGLVGLGRAMPVIFLGVAAFLLNVVLTRIVSVERESIATLKALGYGTPRIAAHYAEWGLIVAALGSLVGVAAGAWLGEAMTRLYTSFFHFPVLRYRLSPALAVEGVGVSLVAAALGGLGAVRRVAALPPAEGLRPEPPAFHQESLVEAAGVKRFLSPTARMVVRSLSRQPGRAALSILGIAFGGAILVVGAFSIDAMQEMMSVEFGLAQRWDVMVAFVEPRSASALDEVRRLPAVVDAEPFRAVPVRLTFGPHSRYTTLLGLPRQPRLNRLIGGSHQVMRVAPGGVVLSAKLGQMLGVHAGDRLTLQALEGRRPVAQEPVVDLVDEYLGTNAYMEAETLHRLMHEGDTLSGAYLQATSREMPALYERLKNTPAVGGVSLKSAALGSFRKTLAESIGMTRTVAVFFAAVIAFGVVYNSARIALSERGRELATLRVIGFTRSEVAGILVSELAILTAAAIPLGLLLGYGLAAATVHAYDTELYRFPLVVAPHTYALSALTLIAASGLSAVSVRRRVRRLDLLAVLKTRE